MGWHCWTRGHCFFLPGSSCSPNLQEEAETQLGEAPKAELRTPGEVVQLSEWWAPCGLPARRWAPVGAGTPWGLAQHSLQPRSPSSPCWPMGVLCVKLKAWKMQVTLGIYQKNHPLSPVTHGTSVPLWWPPCWAPAAVGSDGSHLLTEVFVSGPSGLCSSGA